MSYNEGRYEAITIASGATGSNAFQTIGCNRGSFLLPTMTGTTITFNVSDSLTEPAVGSSGWTACPIEGNETNPLTTASGKTYSLPVKAMNFRWLQLVSGSAEGAARTIYIWCPSS